MSFVHLHVHSEYSLLDGLARIDALVARAAELGMPALAITDHGVMYGAISFYDACKQAGIKPIIGCEMYVTRGDMRQRIAVDDKTTDHLVLLARDQAGYHNLLRIASAAQLEGFYRRPRVDKAYLAGHCAGLIALSGCDSGEVPRLVREDPDKARKAAAWYRDTFGPGNYYIELQQHEGIPDLQHVNRGLAVISRELGIPLVVTNDSHYVLPEDWSAQEVLLCLQTGTVIKDPNHMRMSDQSYYLKTPDEMAALFPGRPEAVSNTLAIAEMCDVQLEFGKYHLPDFPVPEAHTPQSYLAALCQDGVRQRYPAVTAGIEARLQYELGVIHDMGFDTYFLIVWDLIRFARSRDIWWNIRGSAAGSIVAYALGLTYVEPISQGLIFERFLNPGRVTMPDIDMDFPDDRRDEIIQYTIQKYGQDKVAQIITFGTMGARLSIRNAGRALDLPQGDLDRVAKLVLPDPKATIGESLEAVPEMRELYRSSEHTYFRTLIDTAMALEGVAQHASTHAAGVVISDVPLSEYTPLHRATHGEGGHVTQYPMEDLEKIGLLKMDVLGLATLTVMRRTCDLVRERHGVALNIFNIPLDDPSIFALLSTGEVTGLFQVESPGMRRVLRSLKPSRIEDVTAVVALYRPGPMSSIPDYVERKHGRSEVTYLHPSLEPILRDTYGVLVYQEQIIRILTDVVGYSAADADLVRRAIGKKKKQALLSHREDFVRGAVAHGGLGEEAAGQIFDLIEWFARYGFNKAHAADYAVITCQTAYLKAKYPLEFMAATLSVERGNLDKLATVIAETRRLGLTLLPPDINHSLVDFSIQGEGIRYGLGALKNVGDGAVAPIAGERQAHGPFASLNDLAQRVDFRQVSRRALESIIKVGGMDAFGERNHLLDAIDRMMAVSQQAAEARAVGQISMFSAEAFAAPSLSILETVQAPTPASRKHMLNWERELAGTWLAEHPLTQALARLKGMELTPTTEITEELRDQRVTVLGTVTRTREINTKKGDLMAFVTIEDLHGAVELVLFPRTYRDTRSLWQPERIVLVKGRVTVRDGQASVACDFATDDVQQDLPNAHSGPPAPVQLSSEPPGWLAANEEAAGPGAVELPGRAPTKWEDQEALRRDSYPRAQAGDGPRRLHVTVLGTGDHMADRSTLRELLSVLGQHPGHDSFTVYYEAESQGYQLDFPNASTCCDPELLAILGKRFPGTRVRVESMAEANRQLGEGGGC